MKIFRFLAVALVAMIGFNSCSKDCGHDFIEHDYSKDIIGTWTCLKEGFAEALVFKADGTFASVGVANGEYWDYPEATWTLKNNKLALSSGDYKSNVLLEIIPGNCLALVDEKGNRNVFKYCRNDLADEIIGMWVCNDGLPGEEKDIAIITYSENGKMTMTTQATPEAFIPDDFVNVEVDYKVVGDLKFHIVPNHSTVARMVYTPNGTSLGDTMTQSIYILPENSNDLEKISSTFLRVKQTLDLPGHKYDYIKTYVSNVSGEDKDIDFMGYTFNFANMDGSGLDKMLKSLLFAVEFPDKNNLSYSYQMNGNKEIYNTPIVVEGNKMTIKMSAKVPTLKDVVLYAFQDADCTQLHFYMHKTAFVNFYTNMQAMLAAAVNPEFDITNADTIAAIYNEINNAVDTINVSLVMSKTK